MIHISQSRTVAFLLLLCDEHQYAGAPRSSGPRTHFTISVSFVIANVVTQKKSRFNFENLFTFK